MRSLILIAAAGKNNELGKDNDLLWHLPDDFKRFKKLTIGHKIIMGRKTFESFPKPLPKRTHIIITRDKNYSVPHENCIVAHSIKDALLEVENDIESYVIGGGEIYTLALKYATKIELTRVNETFDADTFFPEIDKNNWEIIAEEHHPKDEKHQYDFTYYTYKRK